MHAAATSERDIDACSSASLVVFWEACTWRPNAPAVGPRWRRYGLILVAFLCLLYGTLRTARADVQYVYDQNGRLVQAIAPTGDSAQYQYDPAGNITAIQRVSVTSLLISQISPASGTSGTNVTIWGSGFGTTAAQNIVSFNGVSAAISSATANQLIVQVPIGATTGPITVTSPNGTVTSSIAFQVVAGSSTAPVISSFTPQLAMPGTTVTMSGTGFDPVAVNNKITFSNAQIAPPVSATSTSITTRVPDNAMSGPLHVETANGVATSPSDFFVAPFGRVASDVVATARAQLDGTPVSFTFAQQNKLALVTVDVAAGQSLSLTISNSSISNATVTVLNVDNSVLASASGIAAQTGAKIEVQPVTLAGAYTIVIDCGGSTGSITMNLSATRTDTINVDGPSVTVGNVARGQKSSLKLSANAGQYIGIGLANPTYTIGTANGPFTVSVFAPDGSLLTSTTASSSAADLCFTAAVTGTYLVQVDPGTNDRGYAQIIASNNSVLTLTVDGPALPVVLTRNGQAARVTFSGSTGQNIGLGVTANAIGLVPLAVSNPDGSFLLNNVSVASGALTGYPLTLSATGTYTVDINPQGGTIPQTGTVTLTLSNDVIAGALAIGGTGTPMTISRTGQNARFTLNATVGQNLVFDANSLSGISAIALNIYDPSGNLYTSCWLPNATYNYTPHTCQIQSMPATGIYTLQAIPGYVNTSNNFINSGSTGSAIVTVSTIPVLTSNISIDGPTLSLNFAAGQSARITFSGTAGQTVGLGIPNSNVLTSGSVLNPDGTTLAGISFDSGSFGATVPMKLPATGTYTIALAAGSGRSGTASLTLSSDIQLGSVVLNGAVIPLTINRAGQNARFTFSANSGQTVLVNESSISGFLAMTGQAFSPAGQVTSNLWLDQSTVSNPLVISASTSGTYSVLLTPRDGMTGSMSFTINTPPDVTGNLGVDSDALPIYIQWPGQNAKIAFSATAGQALSLAITNNSVSLYQAKILAPDGSLVYQNSFDKRPGSFRFVPPTSGTYSIVIVPTGTYVGNMTLTLSTDVVVTAPTVGGPGANFSISRPGQSAVMTISGAAGQNIVANVGNMVGLLDSNGVGPTGTLYTVDATGNSLVGGCNFSSSMTTCPLGLMAAAQTYTLIFGNYYASTGSFSVAFTSPPDVVGSVAVNGVSTSFNLTTAGQLGKFTFPATAGQNLGVGLSNDTIGGVGIFDIVGPDGSVIPSNNQGSGSMSIPFSAVATGTHTIRVRPNNAYTGGGTLTVSTDLVAGTLKIGGGGTSVSISRAGQNARLTYSGTSGQNLTLSGSGISGFNVAWITVYTPSGGVLTQCSVASKQSCTWPTLPATGTYTLLVTPERGLTGGIKFGLSGK